MSVKNILIVLGMMISSTLTSLSANAQISGWVDLPVTVTSSNRPVENASVEVYENGSLTQTYLTKANGTVSVKLNLNKQCKIIFKKAALVAKFVEYNTIVPENESDQVIPAQKFAIDLFEDKGDLSQKASVSKAVAKFVYNTTYQDFIFDAEYSKQIKADQDRERREAEALARQQDKGRLDSLNKIWNDSLVKNKSRDSLALLQKAEQDRLRQQREKATADSLANANAQAKAMAELEAKEKARKDSLAKAEAERERLETLAKVKAETDSLAKLDAEKKKQLEDEKARLLAASKEKARQDSISRAESLKARQDSIASVKAKADAESLAKINEKLRKDSLARAEADLKVRQKFVADSTAKAEADKAKQDALARSKADAEAKLADQARKDSIANAAAGIKARQKFVADSTASANADKVKQDALAKSKADADAKLADQARKDSIATAAAGIKARQKFVADSTASANADRIKQDALARAKADSDAKARDQSKKDSLFQASVALKARQKFVADSTASANAEKARQKITADSLAKADAEKARLVGIAKAKADNEAKVKAEADRQRAVLQEKATADSLALIDKRQKDKDEEDRKAKIQADILAKKELLAKTYSAGDGKDKSNVKPTTAVPKIKDSDYKEGVTEETVTESNRTIYRVVVKKDAGAINYQKIVYNWGGIFYFRNESSITESTYTQEIKNAKAGPKTE